MNITRGFLWNVIHSLQDFILGIGKMCNSNCLTTPYVRIILFVKLSVIVLRSNNKEEDCDE